MKTGSCAYCGAEVLLPDHGQPGRSERCLQCDGDIHACLQCTFYDTAAAQECRETQAESVSDKRAANFCTFYEFQGGAGESQQQANDAKAALDKLFKS